MIIGTLLIHPVAPLVDENSLKISLASTQLKLPKPLRVKNVIVEVRPNYWTHRLDFKSSEKSIVTRAIDEINQP